MKVEGTATPSTPIIEEAPPPTSEPSAWYSTYRSWTGGTAEWREVKYEILLRALQVACEKKHREIFKEFLERFRRGYWQSKDPILAPPPDVSAIYTTSFHTLGKFLLLSVFRKKWEQSTFETKSIQEFYDASAALNQGYVASFFAFNTWDPVAMGNLPSTLFSIGSTTVIRTPSPTIQNPPRLGNVVKPVAPEFLAFLEKGKTIYFDLEPDEKTSSPVESALYAHTYIPLSSTIDEEISTEVNETFHFALHQQQMFQDFCHAWMILKTISEQEPQYCILASQNGIDQIAVLQYIIIRLCTQEHVLDRVASVLSPALLMLKRSIDPTYLERIKACEKKFKSCQVRQRLEARKKEWEISFPLDTDQAIAFEL